MFTLSLKTTNINKPVDIHRIITIFYVFIIKKFEDSPNASLSSLSLYGVGKIEAEKVSI